MQLDLTRFRQPVSHVSRRFQPADFGEGEGDAYRVVSPVDIEFELHKDKSRFRVLGRVHGELELSCSRCLEPFRLTVDVPLDLRYWPEADLGAQDVPEDRELPTNEADTSYYRDDTLDLGDLLREQFYLALPMKPLCREGCLGLCPQCGANRNSTLCACQPSWEDPRLAALKQFVDQSQKH